MTPRSLVVAVSLVVFAAVSAFGQTYPSGGAYPPNNSNAPASGAYPTNNGAANSAATNAPTPGNSVPAVSPGPDQPVQPQTPTLTPRTTPANGAPQQQQPPFVLTPAEQAEVDKVLNIWEQYNHKIARFDSKFVKWTYDPVFGKPGVPKFVDHGDVIYAAPDRGRYEIDKTEENGVVQAIPDNRKETWICDGNSVFEYNYKSKKVIEHRLPPEQRGKAIINGPLPFLFGAQAQALKSRYFIRLITPAEAQGQQYWLEAYPRFISDKANFDHAQFIINVKDSTPFALKLIEPNKLNSVVYRFEQVGVNIPPGIFAGNPFRPWLPSPLTWQKVTDDSQLSRSPNSGAGVQR